MILRRQFFSGASSLGFVGRRVAAIVAAAGPIAAQVSAAGAVPLLLSGTDTGYDAGARVQWEFAASLAPAKNAPSGLDPNGGGYTATSQFGVTFVDGDSWARMDLALGYATPSGAYSFHFRVLVDNEAGLTTVVDQFGQSSTYDAGPWSNDVAGTINVSSALLANATGVNKSRFLNVANPFHQAISNADVGASCFVRSSIAMAVAKGHFEFLVDGLKSASAGAVNVGITDAATLDFNSSGFSTRPGSGSNVPGVTVRVAQGGTTFIIYANGGNTTPAIPGGVAAAQGDAVIFEVDTTANTVAIYWYRAATTTATLVTTITMTGAYIPAAVWADGATERGTGALTTFNTSDAFTFNPGYAAFLRAASAGFSPYG
jgi:hypothetical protein